MSRRLRNDSRSPYELIPDWPHPLPQRPDFYPPPRSGQSNYALRTASGRSRSPELRSSRCNEASTARQGSSRRYEDSTSRQRTPRLVDHDLLGRPGLAINDPRYAEVSTLIDQFKTHVVIAYNNLKLGGYRNREIEERLDHDFAISTALADQAVAEVLVSCLGDTGAGKSSCINSILCMSNVAAESDSVHRGTSVVGEYAKALPRQRTFASVQGVHHSQDALHHIVLSGCRAVFAYFNDENEEEQEDSEGQEMAAEAERSALEVRIAQQNLAESFMDIVHSALCDKAGFRSRDDVESYFESKKTEPEDQVVDELLGMFLKYKDSRRPKDSRELHSARDATELFALLQALTRPPRNVKKPHPWSLLQNVRVGLDIHMLNAGIVLADTPGVSDTDPHVAQSTNRYLKDAGMILVFMTLERALSSTSLEANVIKCVALGKAERTAVIITKVDSVGDVPLNNPNQLHISEDHRKKLEQAHKRLEVLNRRLRFSRVDRDRAASDKEFRQLSKEVADVEIQVAEAKSALRQISISIHIADAEPELRSKLRSLGLPMDASSRNLHFVSNLAFQQYLAGTDPDEPPCLSLGTTGIPGLRGKLYGVAAEGKLSGLAQVVQKDLPLACNALEGILTKSRLHQKQQVEELLVTALDRHADLVTDLEGNLSDVYARHMTQTLEANRTKWQREAAPAKKNAFGTKRSLRPKTVLGKWNRGPAITFRTFCEREGFWKYPDGRSKGVMTHWNSDLARTMAADVGTAFEDEVQKACQGFCEKVEHLFGQLRLVLEGCDGFAGMSGARAFCEAVQGMCDNIMSQLRPGEDSSVAAIQRTFAGGLLEHAKAIRIGLTVGNGQYVTEVMTPIYQECVQIAGELRESPVKKRKLDGGFLKPRTHGAHGKRIEVLREKLSGTGDEPSVFAAFADRAAADWGERSEKSVEEVRKLLTKACKEIQQDFNRRFVLEEGEVEETEQAGNAGQMAELHRALAEGIRKFLKPAQNLVRELVEEYEPARSES